MVYLYYVGGVYRVSETRSKWTTIKIPVQVKEKIDYLRSKTNKVTWEVILESITFYEEFLRKPRVRTSTSNLDKLSWYITKLATSFGAFKENPTKENFEYLQKRIEELKKRFGIEADLLSRVASYYMTVKDEDLRKKIRVDLNMAFKQVIKELIIQLMFELVAKEE